MFGAEKPLTKCLKRLRTEKFECLAVDIRGYSAHRAMHAAGNIGLKISKDKVRSRLRISFVAFDVALVVALDQAFTVPTEKFTTLMMIEDNSFATPVHMLLTLFAAVMTAAKGGAVAERRLMRFETGCVFKNSVAGAAVLGIGNRTAVLGSATDIAQHRAAMVRIFCICE